MRGGSISGKAVPKLAIPQQQQLSEGDKEEITSTSTTPSASPSPLSESPNATSPTIPVNHTEQSTATSWISSPPRSQNQSQPPLAQTPPLSSRSSGILGVV